MFEWIEFIVCFGEGLTPDEIKDTSRNGELVYARQLISYFARLYKCGSLKWIGDHFCQDHATILHSIKSIENYLETDKSKRAKIVYYDNLIVKVKGLIPEVDATNKMIDPLMSQISEMESRCINLTLQVAFLKAEMEKIKLPELTIN